MPHTASPRSAAVGVPVPKALSQASTGGTQTLKSRSGSVSVRPLIEMISSSQETYNFHYIEDC